MLALNKRIVITIILTILFIIINTFTISSFAIVSPTSDFYVNDYAELLDRETKDYIINANKSLYLQTGAQIVVVTIPSLESNSLEDYANELFRNFGIGDKTKNNGLLLLLALEERQFRVEVGYGLEGILPDAKTGKIQDKYIIPYLKQNNWNEGIKNGFSAFLEIVANEYNVDVGAQTAIPIENEYVQDNDVDIYFFSFKFNFISLIVGIIFGLLNRRKVIKDKQLAIINNLYYIIVLIVYFNFCSRAVTIIDFVEKICLGFCTIFNYSLVINIFSNKKSNSRGGDSYNYGFSRENSGSVGSFIRSRSF